MKRLMSCAWLIAVVLLTGCATKPQNPVALANTDWSKGGRIGVVMSTMPRVDTQFPGADCLLCAGVAAVANSTLTKHTTTLSSEDLSALRGDIAALLRQKGADVVVFDEALKLEDVPKASSEGGPAKNYAALKSRFAVERLLVINVEALGIKRTYSAYIPTSDPKAYVAAKAFIVDMATNQYQWFMPIEVLKAAEAAWDEPPTFPGLTNAYYQSIETAKDQVLAALRQ